MQRTNHTTLPQLRDPFQNLFHQLFGDVMPEFAQAETGKAPRTNISETDKSYELSFELPGLDEKDIHVDVHDQVLTVRAERKDQREAKDRRWHRVEHTYGRFTRTISLPHDAAPSGIDAVYKNGVLNVTVPKAPEAQPAKIQVRGG